MPFNTVNLLYIHTQHNTSERVENHDAIGDWRYLPLVDTDLGGSAGILQPGSVRGQRMSAGAALAADTAVALRTVRCGLAIRGGHSLLNPLPFLMLYLHCAYMKQYYYWNAKISSTVRKM